MKSRRWMIAALLATMLAGTATEALAWHGHGYGGRARVGVFIGGPVYRPWYPAPYYNPYYYPTYTPTVVQPAPVVYVEQTPAVAEPAPAPAPAVQPAQTGFWYYCEKSKGYYPYVTRCPTGWLKVAAQPAETR